MGEDALRTLTAAAASMIGHGSVFTDGARARWWLASMTLVPLSWMDDVARLALTS